MRLARLKVALRVYQLDQGRPAESLEQLVPKYLDDIFSNSSRPSLPFGYRVSAGERIAMPGVFGTPPSNQPQWKHVPAGTGILWSLRSIQKGAPADGFPPGSDAWLAGDLEFIDFVPNWTAHPKPSKPSEKGESP